MYLYATSLDGNASFSCNSIIIRILLVFVLNVFHHLDLSSGISTGLCSAACYYFVINNNNVLLMIITKQITVIKFERNKRLILLQ